MWTDAFQKGCDPSKNHSGNDTPRPRRSLSQNLGVVLCQMSQNNADAAAVALGRSGGGARTGASRVHVRHLPLRAPPTGCAAATAWSAAAGLPHADVHRPGRCTSRTGARLGAGKRRTRPPGGSGRPGARSASETFRRRARSASKTFWRRARSASNFFLYTTHEAMVNGLD